MMNMNFLLSISIRSKCASQFTNTGGITEALEPMSQEQRRRGDTNERKKVVQENYQKI